MKIYFRGFEWKKFEDPDDEPDRRFHIEGYGHDRDSNPVLIRIDDFCPFAYFELPQRNWSQGDVYLINEFFKKRMGQNAPVKCILTHRKKLYYYQQDTKYPLLLMAFKTEDALRFATNICKKAATGMLNLLDVEGVGKITLHPRETDVGSVKKLTSLRKFAYVSWIQMEAELIPENDERRISRKNGFKYEYLVKWRTIDPVPDNECSLWSVTPTIMSFDIEVLSNNINKMPSALNCKDFVFQIGVTFQRYSQPSTRKFVLLVYGPHNDVEDVDVRRYNSELDLIYAFCDLINEMNPDILIGYNILNFDYSYILRRLLNVFEQIKPCSRIEGRQTETRSLSWRSSAYGISEFIFPMMDGRISIDLLPLVQRDYKLDKYTLDFVSNHFLKKQKAPVEPKEIFRYCNIAHGLTFPQIAEAARGDNPFPFLSEHRLHSEEAVREVIDTFEKHKGTPICPEMVLDVYKKYQSDAMTVVGKYCVKDTLLPIELFERLNYWINLSELAQIVKVPIMDCFTRGQQIRVFSQLYDKIYEKGYYVDFRENPDLPFAGAYVHKPTPGLYQNVISFDFASLYPSIIMAYNICFTTFVKDSDPIPDENCNVVEWEDEGDEQVEFDEDGNVKTSPVKEDYDNDEDEEKKASTKKVVKKKYRFRFIKKEIQKGIFPEFLEELISKRRATKKIMEQEEEYSLNYNILNARQNGLKVSANSGYGFLGVRKGKLGLIEAAMCVTALGRLNIHKIMEQVIKVGGKQVYGDTDSCMVNFPFVPDNEVYPYGINMAKELSKTLPPPMKIEFERAYSYFFILTAKRYANVIMHEDGTPETNEDKIYKKGIVLSRRDNCILLRTLYKEVLLCILYSKGYERAVEIIMDTLIKLMGHSIPMRWLVIIKTLNKEYKSDTNNMFLFAKRLKLLGKMVNPGDRLEHIFIQSEEQLQGMKMVLPEMIEENPDEFKVDYLYYIEKQLMKPIQQLLEIAYKVDKNFMKNILINIQRKSAMIAQINGVVSTIKVKKAPKLKIVFKK